MTIPRLTTLALWGFRSLSSEAVSLNNLTFFVGRNGAGKSNLTDAFSFLAEAMSSSLQVVFDRRGGYRAVSHRHSAKGRSPNIALSVEFGDLGDESHQARYHIDLRSRQGAGFEVAREYCRVIGQDGRRDWFERGSQPIPGWDNSVSGLQPDIKGALVLPLIGDHPRFRPVFRFSCSTATMTARPPFSPTGQRSRSRRSAKCSRADEYSPCRGDQEP